MDSFARGLRNAAKIVEDGIMAKHLKVKRCMNKRTLMQ
jgi:xylose isomerase